MPRAIAASAQPLTLRSSNPASRDHENRTTRWTPARSNRASSSSPPGPADPGVGDLDPAVAGRLGQHAGRLGQVAIGVGVARPGAGDHQHFSVALVGRGDGVHAVARECEQRGVDVEHPAVRHRQIGERGTDVDDVARYVGLGVHGAEVQQRQGDQRAGAGVDQLCRGGCGVGLGEVFEPGGADGGVDAVAQVADQRGHLGRAGRVAGAVGDQE